MNMHKAIIDTIICIAFVLLISFIFFPKKEPPLDPALVTEVKDCLQRGDQWVRVSKDYFTCMHIELK